MKDGHLIQTEELGRSFWSEMSENCGSRIWTEYGQSWTEHVQREKFRVGCFWDHTQYVIPACLMVVSIWFSFVEIRYKKLIPV